MKNLYLWLSGALFTCFFVHLVRLLLKLPVAINYHRVPLKVSLVIALVSLILSVTFYLLGKKKSA